MASLDTHPGIYTAYLSAYAAVVNRVPSRWDGQGGHRAELAHLLGLLDGANTDPRSPLILSPAQVLAVVEAKLAEPVVAAPDQPASV